MLNYTTQLLTVLIFKSIDCAVDYFMIKQIIVWNMKCHKMLSLCYVMLHTSRFVQWINVVFNKLLLFPSLNNC